MRRPAFLASTLATALFLPFATAEERIERFDADPHWEGINNRAHAGQSRTVRQDFGYSRTSNAGGNAGEVGGFVSTAAEAAYYAKPIAKRSLNDRFRASGKLLCRGPQFHVLLGFFNSKAVNEWRTPQCIALRLQDRGGHFFAYVEYATSRWRAGGDSPGGFATVRDPATGRKSLRGFPDEKALDWSLEYDPAANAGAGAATVRLGGETAVCNIEPGHRLDGAEFDRFGLLPVLKSADGGGEVWIDDVSIDGTLDRFDEDPKWEGKDNRRSYESRNVRPWFDFGFSPTRNAGGGAAGELGGLTFRGDCRYRDRMAACGDRLEPLTLDKPLRASGKVALRRAVSDSTTLLGFYHSEDSLKVGDSQKIGWPGCFLGIAVEGPSREGFLLYPAYRTRGEERGDAVRSDPPHILPDGVSHEWQLTYDPTAAGGLGEIVAAMDGKQVRLPLAQGCRRTGARFDRFGIVTTWIDGNGQHVYFDDLRYTFRQ